ncbi:hypothetical protein PGTUg99_030840 [Puccinia graminis f. sp. tritici]|uniref:Uncharacterized protein n=1 Tax=Puccinia graminis f. sp. tritici TaxID=56615 RepID=A0A5B0SDH6_PUCGR|nr:hypothetical protein PGTUg99_030840 [Puccinia graminis f. sp. tritici]
MLLAITPHLGSPPINLVPAVVARKRQQGSKTYSGLAGLSSHSDDEFDPIGQSITRENHQ